MAIIGEELNDYVIDQINWRQYLHGSGVNTTFRNANQLNVLNSNTSWIKLASGVSITDSTRLSEIGFSQTEVENNIKLGLAKNNILFGGTAKLIDLEDRTFDRLQQRSGFLPREANSSYTYGSYGFSPMPGIESADVKTLNRGSIKKATVKLKANNRQQFDIIDLLYMRLGYTVLLEWGNSLFIDNEYGTKTVLRNTFIDDTFFTIKENNGSYLDILPELESRRADYSGNYDGMLGKVSNFNWSFNVDGSYDIELTIISLGDVIESLKTNLSVDQGTLNFLKETGNLNPPTNAEETTTTPDILEENKSSNVIASMLYIWKYLNSGTVKGNKVSINSAEGGKFEVGHLLLSQQDSNDENAVSSDIVKVELTAIYSTTTERANSSQASYETIKKSNEEAGFNPNLEKY
jgi:hypothetical protein